MVEVGKDCVGKKWTLVQVEAKGLCERLCEGLCKKVLQSIHSVSVEDSAGTGDCVPRLDVRLIDIRESRAGLGYPRTIGIYTANL